MSLLGILVGMKPLSERDENLAICDSMLLTINFVGMKPLSERDENTGLLETGLE